MRKFKIRVTLLTLAALTACATPPLPAANLDQQKQKLFAYHDSGIYAHDIARVDAEAQAYILSRAHIAQPVIVLDIDETSLSNWPELAANNLTFRVDGPCDHLPKGPCGLHAWDAKGKDPTIAPTLALFRAARARGIAVFFLTGRDETLRRATEKNLHAAGYAGWTGLIMRPAHTRTPSAADFKAPARAAIEQQGYTIIATIGDQESDLAGGHAERTFKVPNPFYFIP